MNSNQIKDKINQLYIEYKEALLLEQRKITNNNKVVDYLQKEYYVVITNTGCYWCYEGELIELCTPDEMQSLYKLKDNGYVSKKKSGKLF